MGEAIRKPEPGIKAPQSNSSNSLGGQSHPSTEWIPSLPQANMIQRQEETEDSVSTGDKTEVTGGVFLPNLQIGTKEWRLQFDAGLSSATLGFAQPNQWVDFEYQYGKDFKLSLTTDKAGGFVAINPGTGKVTGGLQWTPSNNLIINGSVNSSGVVTASFAYRLFGPPPKNSTSPLEKPPKMSNILIPLVRSTPGGGVSFQSTEEVISAGVNSVQDILPDVLEVISNPALISSFISEHSSTPDGEMDSDFTKIGNTVNAVNAIANRSNTLDLQVSVDVTADPTLGVCVTGNLIIIGW